MKNEKVKPDCPLIGENANIFNLMGIANRTLKRNNMIDEAKEMCNRIISSESYEKALSIIAEYVNITSSEEYDDYDDDEDYDDEDDDYDM